MKKLLLSFIISLIILPAVAQKKAATPVAPVIPVDSITKLITYEGVIEVKDVSADVLYQRIGEWFRTYYKNPGEVIRENDSLKRSITGKPRFRISNPPDKEGVKTDAGLVQYTINVSAREGRFRYEISAYNWKQLSYYPCERWLDTTFPSWAPVNYEYLRQLDSYTQETINNLHQALTHEKPVKNREDW